jgi:Vitamin K-dependent gamma-carboxylase
MTRWNAYWFRPAPYVDLAMVRIITVACQLWLLLTLRRYSMDHFEVLWGMPEALYDPITLLKLFLLPFGWDYRPSPQVIQLVYYVTVLSGVTALIGFRTAISLWGFALGNMFLISYIYSHGDFHHTEAPLMIAFGILALAPSGRTLSVDQWLRERRSATPVARDLLTAEGPFAGWPLRLIQWLFVLIYLSAILSKLVYEGGLEWLNGYTLQYYLIQDTLRKGTLLGGWFAQHHTLVLLSQYMVVTFQATFALCVIFPRLRWIYVPVGLGFHVANWVALQAPFPEWIALYAVLIPWRDGFAIARGYLAARTRHGDLHRTGEHSRPGISS